MFEDTEIGCRDKKYANFAACLYAENQTDRVAQVLW